MADKKYRYATRSGKTTLYKFRPFQTAQQQDWVRQIIREHKVFFPRASELNDPFDLAPRLQPYTREDLIAGADGHISKKPAMSRAERDRLLAFLSSCDLTKHKAEAQANMRMLVENGFSVFSLAGNRDHPMLWSHYALGHTGLCIHFRAEEGSLFGAAMGVIYSDIRPLLPVAIWSISNKEVFERVIFHKGKFWEYEEEYRWPKFPDTDYSELPIRFVGRFAYFPPSQLTGITVGARMPEDRVEIVLSLAESHAPKLPVWRAVETDTFAFDFEQLR